MELVFGQGFDSPQLHSKVRVFTRSFLFHAAYFRRNEGEAMNYNEFKAEFMKRLAEKAVQSDLIGTYQRFLTG